MDPEGLKRPQGLPYSWCSVGIDQSLTGLGAVVHDPFAFGHARVVEKCVVGTDSKLPFVCRYMQLRGFVLNLLRRYPTIRMVGMESTIFGEEAQWSEGAYALFTYVVEAIYLERRDVVFFDPMTLKMLVKIDPTLVKGNLDKSQMVDAARVDTYQEDTPPLRWNHNEADAYHLARFGARFWLLREGLIGEGDLTPAEQHSFLRQHTFVRGKKAGLTQKNGLMFREDDRFFKFSEVPPSPPNVFDTYMGLPVPT